MLTKETYIVFKYNRIYLLVRNQWRFSQYWGFDFLSFRYRPQPFSEEYCIGFFGFLFTMSIRDDE